MTLEEAKEKTINLQHLVEKNPYKPKDRKLAELIVAPMDYEILHEFMNSKFKENITNEELLKRYKNFDFNIYGIFENENPYNLISIKDLIAQNQNWSEIAALSSSDY